MAKPTLTLSIISSEKQLSTITAESLTIPSADGVLTILPGHIPLLARLQLGELHYVHDGEEVAFAVSKGFVDVGPDNHVTILVDTAVAAREISLEKAEAAVRAAQTTMAQTVDQHELMMVEASLKQAMLEVKIAQKSKHSQI